MAITTVGLDLIKPEFPMVGYDERFKEVKRCTLRRHQILEFFSRLPPCQIGLELHLGAHYWGRQFNDLGHEVKLIPPEYLKLEVHDSKKGFFNEARAIAGAIAQFSSPSVAVKTAEQQEVIAIRQMHSQCLKDRNYLCNLTWALLADCGICLPKGVGALRRHLPDILGDKENGLSDRFCRTLSHRYGQLLELDGHLAFYDRELAVHSQQAKTEVDASATVQAEGRRRSFQ